MWKVISLLTVVVIMIVGCVWVQYEQGKVQWMGNPVVRANALSKQADGKSVRVWTQGYLAGYDLGLRRDGVCVWRKTPADKRVAKKK